MFKWVVMIIALLGLTVMFLFILGGPNTNAIDSLVKSGLIPRIAAWICLLLGVYGVARRRFSPVLMFLFFFVAFFFTYLGQFVMKGIY